MEPHIHHRQNDEPLGDELVSAYLDGELTAAEQAQIEERMAVNPEFRQLVEELRGLRTSFDVLPQHRLPADFAERVLRRAEQEVLMGVTDSQPSNPAPISPLVKLAKLDDAPSPEFDGEPAPITLPARPPVEDRPYRRAGFRPFVWTMIAAAAAILILVTNRQPEVRDVPIAKSPEAEREARATAGAGGQADPPAQPLVKESKTVPDEPANGASAERTVGDSRRSGRDLTQAGTTKKSLEEGPALQPAIPGADAGEGLSGGRGDRFAGESNKQGSKNELTPPLRMQAGDTPSGAVREADEVIDRLAPAGPDNSRSRSSAARGESLKRDLSGRAAEARGSAPADESRKDLRDAANDTRPLDVKSSIVSGDSVDKREKADEAGARSSRAPAPAGNNDSPQPTAAEAGFEIQERVGRALKREDGQTENVEKLQEAPQNTNQPGQLGDTAAIGEVLVVQVMLTPDAARQGAFATVLAQNSIRLEDEQFRKASEQETVLGAPAAGPTSTDHGKLNRFGQETKEASSASDGNQPKFHIESPGRSDRANVGGKQNGALQTLPPRPSNAPDDQSDAAKSRGRNVRVQQSLGKGIQPAEPSLSRDKEQAEPENAVRKNDLDADKKKLEADDGTALFADGERVYSERNVAASTDLDVVVVTASDEQINGTLAALQAQQDLFPSVQVASGLGLPALTVQQSPVEGKVAAGVAGAGFGGLGGGALKESPIQSPSEFQRRLSSSGGAPAQAAPGAFGAKLNVEEKLETAKSGTAEFSDIKGNDDAQSPARTTNGALPNSAGGGEAGDAAKSAPSVRLQAQPSRDLNGREARGFADAPATDFGIARRMRLESVAEVLRAQRQKEAVGVQLDSTEVPATEPLKAELGVKAAETAAAKPADALDSQRSATQAAQQRQRFAERPQPLTKPRPANESNEPAAADLKDADLAPHDVESRIGREDRAAAPGAAPVSSVPLDRNLEQRRGGYRAPQGGGGARPAPPQAQRHVLFVFRIAEPAVAGQSGTTQAAGTVLRGAETAREAAGESQIERAPAAPALPAPSRK
jgi:hypothetical protein